jgi:hypothetical protein
VKRTALFVAFVLLTAPLALKAQTTYPSNQNVGPYALAAPTERVLPAQIIPRKVHPPLKPLSRIAVSAGVSTMGVNVQAATNLNRHLNLRATGNALNYNVNNISVNGFNVNGNVKLATAGAGIDYYPFAYHGFRLTPGVLFHNENAVSANVAVTGGTKLSLNGVDYYSSSTDPILGAGSVGLHSQNPAFTLTTGWGNMIGRKGGHWSFPFEIGAAMVGTPVVNLGLTSGQACDVNGQNCVDVTTDPTVNANLQAQIAKYKKDLDPLRYYPILSFGVSYNFKIRPDGAR